MADAPVSKSVLLESRGAVRILTLNRPAKLNALNQDMQVQLLAQLKCAAEDKDARVLILTGAGKAFCAGGDHSIRLEAASAGPERRKEIRRDYLKTMRRLMQIPIPVIAAVNGIAAGFGAGLVALCDMVVMGEGASLSEPHVKFDLSGDTACQIMWPRLTSPIVARELMLTGREVQAQEAVSLGLANRTCAKGDELAAALDMARVFVELPPNGITAQKRLLNHGLVAEFEQLFATTDDAW